jgi:competence protein ComEC
MGDAEGGDRKDDLTAPPKPKSIEGKLLDCCKDKLAADILIAGHHGSRTSSRTALLDAVGAKYFVISSGPKAYSGTILPDQVVVDEFTGRGTLLRTDDNDDKCKKLKDKIGGSADGKPAGCSNIVFTIGHGGSIQTDVWPMAPGQ